MGDGSGSTRVVKSCWGMLLWNSNLDNGMEDNWNSAAMPNNMLKSGLTKTSKLTK
jgi:hypothetical protein